MQAKLWTTVYNVKMYEEYTKEYTDYLNSEAWQRKREECFKMKGRACQKCKATSDLHVHHATYERLFDERVYSDLYVLCNTCHDIYHKVTKANMIQNTIRYINGIETRKRKGHRKKYFTGNWKPRQSVLRKY